MAKTGTDCRRHGPSIRLLVVSYDIRKTTAPSFSVTQGNNFTTIDINIAFYLLMLSAHVEQK